MQESDIIDLLRKNDPDGAAAFIRHYNPLIQYVISPILSNAQDREECASEVAMRVVDKIHLYDENRGSWTAWITSVARNTALNKHRSTKPFYEEAEINEQTPSPDPTPEEQLLQQERRRALKNAITQLSGKDQVLFYRKYYYLQTTEQIASELGMTPRAVEGRLYRIKRRLRKLLGGDSNA